MKVQELVGKTVQSVAEGNLPDAQGGEYAVALTFTDGTTWTFVVGTDD